MFIETSNHSIINLDLVSEIMLENDCIKCKLEKSKKTEIIVLSKFKNQKNQSEKITYFINGLKSDKINLIVQSNVQLMFDQIDREIEEYQSKKTEEKSMIDESINEIKEKKVVELKQNFDGGKNE